MDHLPSIKKNYVLSLVGAVLNAVFPFFTLAYVARVTGPEALGSLYVANALVSFSMLAASLGIPMYGMRELSLLRNSPAFGRCIKDLFVLNAITSLILGLVLVLCARIRPAFAGDAHLLGILAWGLVINVFSFDFVFLALENQTHITLRSILGKSLTLVLLPFLVRGPEDISLYAWLIVGGQFLHNALSLPWIWKWLRGSWSAIRFRTHLRSLSLGSINLFFVNISINLDSVLLGRLSSHTEVGLFNIAVRLPRLVALTLGALGLNAVPRLAFYGHNGQGHDRERLLKLSFQVILFVTLPLCLILALMGDKILSWIVGQGFSEAFTAIQWMAPLPVISGLAGYFGIQILYAEKREKELCFISGMAALTSVFLMILLAPAHGHLGAVLACLGSEFTTLGLQLFVATRLGLSPKGILSDSWRILPSLGILLAYLLWLPDLFGPTMFGEMAGLALGGMLYVLVNWVMNHPVTLLAKGGSRRLSQTQAPVRNE